MKRYFQCFCFYNLISGAWSFLEPVIGGDERSAGVGGIDYIVGLR